MDNYTVRYLHQGVLCQGVFDFKKSDFHEALHQFIKDYGSTETLIYDGVKEKVGSRTDLEASVKKYGINNYSSEREISNQNSAEGVII